MLHEDRSRGSSIYIDGGIADIVSKLLAPVSNLLHVTRHSPDIINPDQRTQSQHFEVMHYVTRM